MISPDRLLPQQQIYNFLRSVTIKYDPIAQYLNSALITKGIAVNTQDPTTWKYYINMTGAYHASDTPMYVVSLDNQEQMLFTPANLASNPRTRAAYTPGGQYYSRLCETYPDQIDLIKSILFPVSDMEKAILADDFTLLSYGTGYLEIYEQPVLIMAIEKFLLIYKERWYFDFLDDEPYFYLTAWGSLWTFLAMLLLSERMGNINTPYVHSWHIWNELEAQGISNYSDILDRKKSMMLYQNIDYLKANAGKQQNLILLANRLLDDFGVGLYGRRVVQESETGAANYELTPQLAPTRIPTDYAVLTTEIPTETVAVLQSQIYQKGLTPFDTAEAHIAIERKLGDTTLNSFMTKFLEIRPIAKNKPYADVLNLFLVETLVTSIIRGYYTKAIEVSDPVVGGLLFMSPKELLALYHYACQKSLGLTPDGFPTQVRLYKAFDTEIGVPEKTIFRHNETVYLSMLVDSEDYLSGISYNTTLQTPSDFTTNLTDLWLKFMSHTLMDQSTCSDKLYTALQYLYSFCHTRREETMSLVTGYDSYSEWLGPEGIDIQKSILSQYDVQEDPDASWGALADAIISTLVPLNDILNSFGNFTLSDAGYERLRQLFVQMCSYRVVFLDSTRVTPEFASGFKISNWYGPDHTETYADVPLTLNVNLTSSSIATSNMDPYKGVDTVHSTQSLSTMNNIVTATTHMGKTATSQTREYPKFTYRTPSKSMKRGPLNLTYMRAQMIPDIP